RHMVCRAARPGQPAWGLRHLFLQPADNEPDHASARRRCARRRATDLDAAGPGMAAWRPGAAGAQPGATGALGLVGHAAGADLCAGGGESVGRAGVFAAVLSALCSLLGAGASGGWAMFALRRPPRSPYACRAGAWADADTEICRKLGLAAAAVR